jgi:hypothetical protein
MFEKPQTFEKSGNDVMQPSGIIQGRGIMRQNWIARPEVPLLARFLGKFVLDILPAALASVIGGFLFTQYQFGHAAAPQPAAVQAAPASAEMMALVRDEHAMIIDYLKTQMAAEKSRLVAEDADSARVAADAQAADSKAADAKAADAKAADAKAADAKAAEAATRRVAAALVASKSATSRNKAAAAVAAVPHAPLVIARAGTDSEQSDSVPPAERIARDPDSLLAKTLDLKDHVVTATRHVVSVIGDMFASLGERIGGATTGGRQFSSDS